MSGVYDERDVLHQLHNLQNVARFPLFQIYVLYCDEFEIRHILSGSSWRVEALKFIWTSSTVIVEELDSTGTGNICQSRGALNKPDTKTFHRHWDQANVTVTKWYFWHYSTAPGGARCLAMYGGKHCMLFTSTVIVLLVLSLLSYLWGTVHPSCVWRWSLVLCRNVLLKIFCEICSNPKMMSLNWRVQIFR